MLETKFKVDTGNDNVFLNIEDVITIIENKDGTDTVLLKPASEGGPHRRVVMTRARGSALSDFLNEQKKKLDASQAELFKGIERGPSKT